MYRYTSNRSSGYINGVLQYETVGKEDFYVLNWQCTVSGPGKEDCKGSVIRGTGKFKAASGKMVWTDIAGFGEGKGTFKLN